MSAIPSPHPRLAPRPTEAPQSRRQKRKARIKADAPPTLRSRLRGLWRLSFSVTALGAAAATAGAFFPQVHWSLDMLTHFGHVFGAAALLAALALLPLRCWLVATVCLATAGTQAWRLSPAFLPAEQPVLLGATAGVRAVAFNVLVHNENRDDAAQWLQDSRADVIALTEIDADWVDRMDDLKGYRAAVAQPADSAYGIGIWVRDGIRFKDARIREPNGGVPRAEATLYVKAADDSNMQVRVMAVHPLPPRGHRYTVARDRYLAQTADAVVDAQADDMPVVVLGDFNATPTSRALTPLTRAGLRNAAAGFGLHGTWPARTPKQVTDLFPLTDAEVPAPLALPIDHILVSGDVQVRHHQVGPELGSDHRPVLADLTIGRR